MKATKCWAERRQGREIDRRELVRARERRETARVRERREMARERERVVVVVIVISSNRVVNNCTFINIVTVVKIILLQAF